MKNEVAVCVKLLSQGHRIVMCGERSCLTTNMYIAPLMKVRGVGKGGGGVRRPHFPGANFIHFLYKVLGTRSVQKEPF